jgi:hypothetical protein
LLVHSSDWSLIVKEYFLSYLIEIESFINIFQQVLMLVAPNLLSALISFTEEKNQNVQIGYFLTILLFSSSIIQVIIGSQYFLRYLLLIWYNITKREKLMSHKIEKNFFDRMFVVGTRIRTCLMGAIYKKVSKTFIFWF